MMIYSLQNPLWEKKNVWKTSASRQDEIAASRFILSLKYVLIKTHTHKFMKQCFEDRVHQVTINSSTQKVENISGVFRVITVTVYFLKRVSSCTGRESQSEAR